MRLRVALPVALVIFVALILLVICSGLNIAENKKTISNNIADSLFVGL